MAIEEPSYEVIAVSGDIEFRRYSAFVVAQTSVPAQVERPAAANRAFIKLLRYIQGDNDASAQIAMTAPVMQQRGVSTSSSAPVGPNTAELDWRVSFVLPAGFSLASAPAPADPGIQLQEMPARVVAALAYSGRWTEQNVCKHGEMLLQQLQQMGITPLGPVGSAFYNAPFVPPFLRRNEVLVEVSNAP